MSRWTEEELRLLEKMRGEGMELARIAAALDRSLSAVFHKVYDKPIPRATGGKTELTETELEWLASHYGDTKNNVIMATLGISHSTLHRLARRHGLTKTPEFLGTLLSEMTHAAKASHMRNGTYPPKGAPVRGFEKRKFRTGVNPRSGMTPERVAEMEAKRLASWRRTYDSDRRRTLVYGLEQRTNFRFVKQSHNKLAYRYNLRRHGYVEDPDDHNTYYYASEDMRSRRMESHACRHGVHILPMPQDADSEETKEDR